MGRVQVQYGEAFEELIKLSNAQYRREGKAVVHKVPTQWIPIRNAAGKICSAKVEEKASVDFLGNFHKNYLAHPIAFDCKSTGDERRINWKELQDHQYDFLRDWQATGGVSFVLVEWRPAHKVVLVPFDEWGREGKSLLLPEVPTEWLVPHRGGLPDYLRTVDLGLLR